MTIETSITNRRELASALAQYLNTRAVYLGPPTFAYQIGDIHLSREGILSGDDLDGIFPFLEMQGIITAQPKRIQEPAENTAPNIRIPLEGYTPVNLRNLFSMLYSKQWLIRKACCMSALHIPERAVNSMPTDRDHSRNAKRRVCPTCQKEFTTDRRQTYCSHACYIRMRFGRRVSA